MNNLFTELNFSLLNAQKVNMQFNEIIMNVTEMRGFQNKI